MKHSYIGLSYSQVNESRENFGSNEISPYQVESFWDKLAANFKDPIIIILIFALVIILVLSFFELSEWYEAVAIAIAVALATLVSTFSEFKNESSFQKLQEEASRIQNNVFRDGQLSKISVNDDFMVSAFMLGETSKSRFWVELPSKTTESDVPGTLAGLQLPPTFQSFAVPPPPPSQR